MAEFVFKALVKEKGKEEKFSIASAAVSSEELGNPVYPPVRQLLAQKGISTKGKTARRLTEEDYYDYDFIIAMDESNLRWMSRILPDMDKSSLLMTFAGEERDVEDPWYTRDFDSCYDDVLEGCQALYAYLEERRLI